jgi:hypothetical protein
MNSAICRLIVLSSLLMGSIYSHSQVAINSDGSPAATSAILDVKATNKGLLPPRISLVSVSDVITINSPVAGLLIYNTNASVTNGCGTGFYYFNGTKWVKLASNTTHYLGELYGGGNIFWLDETGEHGLISAVTDQGTSAGTHWFNNIFSNYSPPVF